MDRQDFENKLIEWLDRPEAPEDLTSNPEERHALRAWRHTSDQIRHHLQQHEPPASLDQQILRAARQQAAQYATPPARSWLHGFLQNWQPLATFATLTLVVGMTFLLSQKTLQQETSAPSLSARDIAPAAPQTGQRAAHSPMPSPSSAAEAPNTTAKQKQSPSGSLNTLPAKTPHTAEPTRSQSSETSTVPSYAPPPPVEEQKKTSVASPPTPPRKAKRRSFGQFFRDLFSPKRAEKSGDTESSSLREGRKGSTQTPQPVLPPAASPAKALPSQAPIARANADGATKKEDADLEKKSDPEWTSPTPGSPPPARMADPEPPPADRSNTRSRRGRSAGRYKRSPKRYRAPTHKNNQPKRYRASAHKNNESKHYRASAHKDNERKSPSQRDDVEATKQEPSSLTDTRKPEVTATVRNTRKRRPRLARPARYATKKRAPRSQPEGLYLGGGRASPPAPPSPPAPLNTGFPAPKKPITSPRSVAFDKQAKTNQPTQPVSQPPLPAPQSSQDPAPRVVQEPAPSSPKKNELPSDLSVVSNEWSPSKKQQMVQLYRSLQNDQTDQAIALSKQILDSTPPAQRDALRQALLAFAKKYRYHAFFQQLSNTPAP